jgi:hypothetical protein
MRWVEHIKKLPPLLIFKGKNMTIDKIPYGILSVLAMENLWVGGGS